MVLIATFAALVLLRYLAVLALAAFVIRPVRACPACFAPETLAIRRRWPALLSRRFEWRWCPECGWQAVARK